LQSKTSKKCAKSKEKIMEMKTENTEKAVSILEKSIDAEKGFKTAFENASDRSLKNYFFEKAKQRATFINELENELKKYNENSSETSGSFTGDLHRAWMDIKSLVSSNQDEALLQESIRGEKAAKDEFEKVLDEEYLWLELRNILRKQYMIIKHDFETIKTLENVHTHFY
jgi:uncharacterized protein (TIGR02284 family)